jgi:hypothetical protein
MDIQVWFHLACLPQQTSCATSPLELRVLSRKLLLLFEIPTELAQLHHHLPGSEGQNRDIKSNEEQVILVETLSWSVSCIWSLANWVGDGCSNSISGRI